MLVVCCQLPGGVMLAVNERPQYNLQALSDYRSALPGLLL